MWNKSDPTRPKMVTIHTCLRAALPWRGLRDAFIDWNKGCYCYSRSPVCLNVGARINAVGYCTALCAESSAFDSPGVTSNPCFDFLPFRTVQLTRKTECWWREEMIAPLASGSSVKVLLRVTDAKYGLLPFFFLPFSAIHRINITEINCVIHWIMIYSHQWIALSTLWTNGARRKVYSNFYCTLSSTSYAQINSRSRDYLRYADPEG